MSTLFPPMTPERRARIREQADREAQLAAVQADHVCGECGGLLGLWHWRWGDDREPVLACMTDQGHHGWRRLHGPAEAYRLGEYVSPYAQQILERKGRKRMSGTDLATLDEAGMLRRVEMARFPEQLTGAQKKMVANVAMTYGLDPLMGELTVYQGNPYVSIDGRYRKARETGLLDGVETRPASPKERLDWEIPEGDFFFRCEVFVKGSSRPFVGWGRVRKEERSGKSAHLPVVAVPQRMAEKRAEAQALRKAFGIPLPSFGGESRAPVILEVDRETGEVIDADTARAEIEADHAPEEPTEAQETPQDAQQEPEPPLAAPKLTCVNDVLKAAHERYGLQPKQVYDILGVKSSVDVTDLGEAWGKIAAAQEG